MSQIALFILWRMTKFAIVGAIGTVVNLGILYMLTEFAHVWYMASEIIAVVCVFAFNFWGNVLNGNIKLDSKGR